MERKAPPPCNIQKKNMKRSSNVIGKFFYKVFARRNRQDRMFAFEPTMTNAKSCLDDDEYEFNEPNRSASRNRGYRDVPEHVVAHGYPHHLINKALQQARCRSYLLSQSFAVGSLGRSNPSHPSHNPLITSFIQSPALELDRQLPYRQHLQPHLHRCRCLQPPTSFPTLTSPVLYQHSYILVLEPECSPVQRSPHFVTRSCMH